MTTRCQVLAHGSEVIERGTSVVGRYCCKSRKSSDAENLAKVDLRATLSLRRFSAPLGKSVIDFG
jgi:hypothetical protein